MTVDFNSDGRLEIRAETHTESVALKHLVAQNDAASRVLIFTDIEAMVETPRGVVWCIAGEDLKLDPNNPCYVQVRDDGKIYNSQTPIFSIGELKTAGKQGERVKVLIKMFDKAVGVLR